MWTTAWQRIVRERIARLFLRVNMRAATQVDDHEEHAVCAAHARAPELFAQQKAVIIAELAHHEKALHVARGRRCVSSPTRSARARIQ